MKKLFFIPIFLLFVGFFLGCGDGNDSLTPYIDVNVYDLKHNLLQSTKTPLPNDTVWKEVKDSVYDESGDSMRIYYYDILDTIYREVVDSIFIPYNKDTLTFKFSTNSSWEIELLETQWDTIYEVKGQGNLQPIDWFVRPKKIAGGGNGSLKIAVKENDRTRKRGILCFFKTKNAYVKKQFMFVQDHKPSN